MTRNGQVRCIRSVRAQFAGLKKKMKKDAKPVDIPKRLGYCVGVTVNDNNKTNTNMSKYEIAEVVMTMKHLTNPRTLKTDDESKSDRAEAKKLANKHGFEFPEDLIEAWQ